MLRWIGNRCQTTAYALKSDDDVMINVENLMNRLNEFKSGITGLFQPKSPPIRQSNSENTKHWFKNFKFKQLAES